MPVTEIYSVTQALDFLYRWPVGRKGPVYQTAVKSCAAVRNHHVTAEEARKSFQSFARITGILVRDIHHFPGEDADGEALSK